MIKRCWFNSKSVFLGFLKNLSKIVSQHETKNELLVNNFYCILVNNYIYIAHFTH